jgi:hypothetical protein
MQAKQLVYALAAVWLVLFVASFVALQLVQDTGNETAQVLNRVATFLTWQSASLTAASVLALVAYRAAARGVAKVKLPGYAPLALNAFVVSLFILIVAYRVLVAPVLL